MLEKRIIHDNINISRGVNEMRKQFTTSIDTNISDNFKKSCENYNFKR